MLFSVGLRRSRCPLLGESLGYFRDGFVYKGLASVSHTSLEKVSTVDMTGSALYRYPYTLDSVLATPEPRGIELKGYHLDSIHHPHPLLLSRHPRVLPRHEVDVTCSSLSTQTDEFR